MRGQRFAVEIPWMPVMVDVGPGRGRGYVSITDGPGSLVVGRGARFAPDARVGLELPGTSYANVDQLNTQIAALARAVVAAAGADPRLVPNSGSAADIKAMHDALASYPGGGENSAIVDSHDKIKAAGKLGTFWYDEVAPFLTEWQDFQQKHSHWYDLTTQLATGAEVYQAWQSRLDALRSKAVSLGVKVPVDQAPISKPTSIFDQIGKNALIAGGVLAGLIILVAAEK
jgi:hypothetical protein